MCQTHFWRGGRLDVPIRVSCLIVFLFLHLRLQAELPLPSVTLYGTITTLGGEPVLSGAIEARVQRAAAGVLAVAGEFKEDQGTMYYVVNIPMETSIGAPGPNNAGAREGDTLTAIVLDGAVLTLGAAVPALRAGALLRVNATATTRPEIRYVRGDCNGDRGLDIADVVRMLFLLFVSPAPPPCREACDADGGGSIQINDVVLLLHHLYLEQAAPPPPGANCAVDPSPSSLGCINSPCPAG
jgi:hypothetical protein